MAPPGCEHLGLDKGLCLDCADKLRGAVKKSRKEKEEAVFALKQFSQVGKIAELTRELTKVSEDLIVAKHCYEVMESNHRSTTALWENQRQDLFETIRYWRNKYYGAE